MPPPLAQPRFTPERYLALERAADHRSELINGQIYAMSGASRRHNLIVLNFGSELRAQLRGRPCETYVSDMRVKVADTTMYTYPDVSAVCGSPRFEDTNGDTLLNPDLIAEVLSPSTERHDRGVKFAHYRRIETLREYILLSQDHPRIEHYTRDGEHWVFTEITDVDGTLPIVSLGCTLSVREIYERVQFGDDAG